MDKLRSKMGFIIDMDGVLYHGSQLLSGVVEFAHWLTRENKRFLFLTNSSMRTPRELSLKLSRMGIELGPEHFYTSALATASFLRSQRPGGSVFVIGEAALTNALYDEGFAMDDEAPDYVVVGESRTYGLRKRSPCRALGGKRGARLIAANPDLADPSEDGGVHPLHGRPGRSY